MNLPKLLILFRLLLAPVLIILAWKVGGQANFVILLLMFLGLLSDVLDGIIARKRNQSDAKLRRMDSQVDMLFWLSVGIAAWILHSELLREHVLWIVVLLSTEALAYVVSLVKFRKETCTHAFLSKLWGVSLLVAFSSIIGFEHAGIPFWTALIVGYLSHLDRILISLILPRWTHDIPSAYHAWLIRKGIPFKRHKLLNG